MSRKRWTLIVAILGSGIVFLDSTIVNVALPKIGEQLPTTLFGVLEGQSYVYNGYLLSLSALLILAGALNDFYGRRRMFALGLAGFGVTSLLCGIAPTIEWLVVFRVLQGAAGALLVPGSLALITATFQGEEQGRAFGLWAGASGATTILGPFIGGVLVDTISWRAAFLMNIPLIVPALWATLRHVEESRDEQATGHFDWLGAFVVALAVGGLSFGAIYGQQREWRDPLAFIALAAGGAAALVCPFLMARSPHPLVPLHLFRSRNFTVTNLSTLVIYGALYVAFYYAPLFMQGTLGYTAAAVGLATIPGTLLLTFLSSRFGALSGRYGPRWFMAGGPAIMALGILWLARVPADSQAWTFRADVPAGFMPPAGYLIDFLPGFVVFGFGLAVMVAPLTTCLMTAVAVRYSGLGSAINNAISRVGPQLAGAAIFVAITVSFYHGMARRVPGMDVDSSEVRAHISPLNRPGASVSAGLAAAARDASTDAFRLAMVISAALLAAGAAINAIGIKNPTQSTS
ncbi:MAG: MFS transporter [Armatimonadota bacterium]